MGQAAPAAQRKFGMELTRSDIVWRELACSDPYWAVLSLPEYRAGAMTPEARAQFFATGEGHIGHVLNRCRQLNPGFAPKVALDFGCGVGRLSRAMLRLGMKVFAVDISSEMLALCKENCARDGLHELTAIASDDTLSGVTEQVDFAVSTITFQHIHPARGIILFEALLGKLRAGGMFWVHLLFGDGRRNGPGGGGHGVEAQVEMNDYDLASIVEIISRRSPFCHLEFSSVGDRMGANFYGRCD
jgi:SAM-dependent methyltransferase